MPQGFSVTSLPQRASLVVGRVQAEFQVVRQAESSSGT